MHCIIPYAAQQNTGEGIVLQKCVFGIENKEHGKSDKKIFCPFVSIGNVE